MNAATAAADPATLNLSTQAVSPIARLARDSWRVLMVRFWTFVAVSLTVFVLGTIGILLLQPRYEARALLKIDPSANQVADLNSAQKIVQPDRAKVESEVKVIRSRDLARLVVKQLALANDREFQENVKAGTQSESVLLDTVAANVQEHLDVSIEPTSYVITVSFTSIDAAKAAKIANAFVSAYVNQSVGSKTGTAALAADWLAQQRARKEAELRNADAAVAQYKASTGLVVGAANGTVTEQQIGPIAAQLAQSEATAAEARAKFTYAQTQIKAGDVEAVAKVLTSPVVTALRTQRGQIVQNRDDILARYGPRHPDTIRVNEQLRSIDTQIIDEARRLAAAMESDAKASEAQAASLRSALGRLKADQSQNTRASVIATQLERDAESKRSAFDDLAKAQQQADVAARNSLGNIQIVESARAPDEPTKPQRSLLIALAFVVGIICGVGTLIVQETLSRSVQTIDDVERKLGLRLIAGLPLLTPKQTGSATPVDYILSKPMSLYGEGLRSLRTALLPIEDGAVRVRRVAIVSSLPDEGKTTVSLNLARIMAMAGDKVILIDTDLRRAGAAKAVGYKSAPGLVEVLSEGVPVNQAIQHDIVEGLDILANAEPLFTPADHFSGKAFADLLTKLEETYDVIVLDTPPFLTVSDSKAIIANVRCHVALVIKWNETPMDAVESTIQQLASENAHLIGAVVNGVDPYAEMLGAGYYSNKYAAYYQQ